MNTLAHRLREARKCADLSQQELAEKAGLSQGYLSQLETGERANVTLRIANALEDALGMRRGGLSEPVSGDSAA